MATPQIKLGPRLPFVVVPLEGTVRRRQYILDTKTVGKGKHERTVTTRKEEYIDEPAGYMVYFNNGHALRMTKEQLRQYQLNRRPVPINADGLTHAMLTQQAATQINKMRDAVIKGVTHTVGPELLIRDAEANQVELDTTEDEFIPEYEEAA